MNPELILCILRLLELKLQMEQLQAASDNETERSRITLAVSSIDQALEALSEPVAAV